MSGEFFLVISTISTTDFYRAFGFSKVQGYLGGIHPSKIHQIPSFCAGFANFLKFAQTNNDSLDFREEVMLATLFLLVIRSTSST